MSHNATGLQVPVDLTSPVVLRRFLQSVIEQLDVAYGYRGDDQFVTATNLSTGLENTVDQLLADLATTSSALAIVIAAVAADTLESANEYTDDNSTKNVEQAAIADLAYTKVVPSAAYVQAEATQVADDVKTHADKLDTILAALRLADIIA